MPNITQCHSPFASVLSDPGTAKSHTTGNGNRKCRPRSDAMAGPGVRLRQPYHSVCESDAQSGSEHQRYYFRILRTHSIDWLIDRSKQAELQSEMASSWKNINTNALKNISRKTKHPKTFFRAWKFFIFCNRTFSLVLYGNPHRIRSILENLPNSRVAKWMKKLSKTFGLCVVLTLLIKSTRWQPYFGTNFQHMHFFTYEADRNDRRCKSETHRVLLWCLAAKKALVLQCFMYGSP